MTTSPPISAASCSIPLREPAPLELREQAELPELVESHNSEILVRASSVPGSSAYSAS